MNLNDYFNKWKISISFNNIKDDSRLVKPGDLFVAWMGKNHNGESYIADAISSGASFIISSRHLDSYPSLYSSEPKRLLESLLHFYYHGHEHLKKIAVTGTDGKTTTSTLIHKILDTFSKSILIGTNGIYYSNTHINTSNTTPSNAIIYNTLEEAYLNNIKFAVIEMSSEGILDNRGTFLSFDAFLFTNLSNEHLNTHKTMKSYLDCKLKLLNLLSNDAICIINEDSKYYNYIISKIRHRIISYGINNGDYKAKNIRYDFYHLEFDLYYKNILLDQININLFGNYNVYNTLGAIAYTYELGIPLNIIKNALANNIHIDGRFEYFNSYNRHFIVDFGHTPQAFKSLLLSLVPLKEGKIFTIFGAQGGKDRKKRPLMGLVASTYSDVVILTSEDPKNESLFSIIKDLSSKIRTDYYITLSRHEAIALALSLMKEKDILIIFGKGNENIEVIKNYTFKHNDMLCLKTLINSQSFLSKGVN